MKKGNEVFRHLRPQDFCLRKQKTPQKNGGISFLCVLNDVGEYDFWIHICPLTAGFSVKSAVHRLRHARVNASPWGTITLDERPLLDQLVDSIFSSELPTTLLELLTYIQSTNLNVARKLEKINNNTSIDLYESDN